MKKYQTILAYYSTLLATGLIVWSFIALPRPDGFVFAVLILPMSIYFWVLISGKVHHSKDHDYDSVSEKSSMGLMIALTLSISTAGILIYSTFTKNASLPGQTSIASELSTIHSDLSILKRDVASLEKIIVELDLIKKNLIELDTKGSDDRFDSLAATPTSTPEATIDPGESQILNKKL